MLFRRDSGILLHVTSLPGPAGNGDLGPAARGWVLTLAEAGQDLWQVLPLGPTGFGDSPYQAHSSFAGHPLLVSLEDLAEAGWLAPGDLADPPEFTPGRADFEFGGIWRRARLQRAAEHFRRAGGGAEAAGFEAFRAANAGWLRDWARYAVVKEREGHRAWTDWPEPLRDRDPVALHDLDEREAAAIARAEIIQWFFFSQWARLRAHARAHGVKIVGDLPIFVAHDSADVWAARDHFRLLPDGSPEVVAGVPPDYFSATGQRWGNPLYAWERHAADDFAWWRARLGHLLGLVDVVRIDHFRGLAACWEIPGDHPTAEHGRWIDVPGRDLLASFRRAFGAELPIIAEDLGVITPDVVALRDDFGLPGLRILQFAFGTDPMRGTFLPEAYVPNCVAYTGTHDNDTTVGWFFDDGTTGASTRSAAEIEAEREAARAALGTDGREIHWDFVRALLQSAAGAVVFPLQDVLGLGSPARMNRPGTGDGNWRWRLVAPPDPLALRRLRDLTAEARRGRFAAS